MSKYQTFIFKDYRFDAAAKQLTLSYSLDEAITFNETYRFNFDLVAYDPEQLDQAVQNLFFTAGVSYYKTYIPAKIAIQKGHLDETGAAFFAKTYQRGLGEFFYTNKLNPHLSVDIQADISGQKQRDKAVENGLLIGIGGGKDSLLSVELLRSEARVATWSLDHQEQLHPLVERIGLPHFWVEREWDRQLLELNKQDALNGHVPISAILACVGTIVSILAGYSTAVVSNENSANEPTLHYQGVDINHQYSKSLEFEKDYQDLLEHCFGDSLHYFSFLRPLSELRIAELFAGIGFEKYKDVFSSCNRAFTHDSNHMFWDGTCPKCAFVFLALTPFVAREALETLFGGKNLLLDPALEPTYRQLLGIEGDKPLECVGEIKESRAAMRLAQKFYPELAKYRFELPDDYDYLQLAGHSMPAKYYDDLLRALPDRD